MAKSGRYHRPGRGRAQSRRMGLRWKDPAGPSSKRNYRSQSEIMDGVVPKKALPGWCMGAISGELGSTATVSNPIFVMDVPPDEELGQVGLYTGELRAMGIEARGTIRAINRATGDKFHVVPDGNGRFRYKDSNRYGQASV